MERDKRETWDLIFKWISLCALMISAIWTYYKYRDDRRIDLTHRQQEVAKDVADKQKELNSFIFQRQANLYFDAARTAATLAKSADPKRLSEARERFNELFYGELVVVEDRRVELAMIAFHRCLPFSGEKCERPLKNQFKQDICPKKQFETYQAPVLSNLSLELAACTRAALQDDRKIQFGNQADATTSCPYN